MRTKRTECWPADIQKQTVFLRELCQGTIEENKQNKINNARVQSTGRFVSAKVKLALTLRLLARGTYMDLTLLYKVGMTYAYDILHDVVCNWINDDRLVNINGEDYLNDIKRMAKVANDFATGSKELLKGAVGALNKWLVKIRRPTKIRDEVSKCIQISFRD